ncbi:MAG: NAD(P)/FAD-dependent oxidoreductase [Erythrobacter sp.]|nr:NAD(P)/FAD-dependent oxidoreductase [Erythrobacter sp.]
MDDVVWKGSGEGLRYAIVGGGMSGIMAAIRLIGQGETNFTVFEKEADIGGTWRDNRYPGLTCDTPSHAYSYSFALNPKWSSYYASGPEIHRYFKDVASDFGVMPHVRCNSEVSACIFDEDSATWTVGLTDGGEVEVDVVIAASGVLHYPKMPDIPGLDTFAGKAFHSARWDDSAVVDGARVGVIGCGSTGIQIVNALSNRAERLVHFQRSPQWIMPVPQFDYSAEQQEAFAKDNALIDAIRHDPDYWAAIYRFTDGITDFNSPQIAEIEEYCRQNLENSVRDPELREKLRPNYRAACKRLIYSWEYYECVQRPAVYVETGAIAQVEPEGVRMQDGTFHPLDVLVLATGFKADRFIRPAVVKGRGGQTLDDFWNPRPTAHLAVTLPDFPNFFMLNGPTGPVGNFPLIDIAEMQWDYLKQLLEPVREGRARCVEPTREAFEAYEERRIAAARKTIFGSGCSSWYLDDTGVPATWPWSYQAFVDAMAAPDWQEFRLEA